VKLVEVHADSGWEGELLDDGKYTYGSRPAPMAGR
jgi:hypothetical protein